MRINSAFWIYLARLATMLETADQHTNFLKDFEQRAVWKLLSEADREALSRIRKLLESLTSFD
jgi:hypothetical protein